MKRVSILLVGLLLLSAGLAFAGGSKEAATGPVTLTIATVNNPDMVIMQKLSENFTKATNIKLNFVVLPENELRQKVTEDVGLGSGKYDVVTIGTYDTPFWAKNKWISSLEPMFSKMTPAEQTSYDRADLLKPIRSALSYDNALYALPFYGESSMIFYRKDLFQKAGLTMPEAPTWQQIYNFAVKLNDPANGQYGIALRGLPGWGEILAPFDTIINAFGARWFDMNWNPTFNEPAMKKAWEFYKKILTNAGEPSPTTDGYTECLALMQSGKAAMWYDATVSAGTLQAKDSQVAGKIGYALAPSDVKGNTGWLWAWSLGIESASKHKEAAFKFLTWATDRKYIDLVGNTIGWAQVPPGTRESTYTNPQYLAAAPFAGMVLKSIENASYDHPTVQPVPYKGVQYVSIPEFQSLGERVSQELASYITGKETVDQALANSQAAALQVAKQGGYLK
ncbi:MAG TPA: sugar ABC transporter substrate-binding protein [Spirochaetia bacterium]|nr:sugar ABC transporter substrate-binding protein [Spirochaetia bacterium]